MNGSRASPAFSVIVPTYNRANFLPRAIHSVLDQSFSNFELIVVDDGSTDNTRQVLRAIRDSRLRYCYQDNLGAAAARNNGVTVASGRYVTFLDSDDEAIPTWLAKVAEVFRAKRPAITCCGVFQTYYHRHGTTERIILPRDLGPMFNHQRGLFITGGSFALTRDVFDAIGGYSAELRAGQHTELSFRLIPYCNANGLRIHNIMEPLVRRHIHKGPSIRKDPNALLQGSLYFLEHHVDKLRHDPPRYADQWAVAGVAAMRSGDFQDARKYFRSAIKVDAWNWRNYVRLFLAWVPPIGKRYWLRSRSSDS